MRTDSGSELHQGHVLNVLRSLPDESVQMCVTSPPYWGLRDYGTDPQIWGGDKIAFPDCVHEWGGDFEAAGFRSSDKISPKASNKILRSDLPNSQFCTICGAWKGSLGLEPTPDLYVEHLVEIFSEVNRILKPDGTIWVNIGDSYAGSGKAGSNPEYHKKHTQFGKLEIPQRFGMPTGAKSIGLKPKDLVGIPWKTAFALQKDGWYLRSDIIWHKPNPMPNPVKDRPTTSHEYIFLLSKNKKYYYDADAIKEDCSPSNVKDFLARKTMDNKGTHGGTRPDLSRSREEYMPDDFKRNKRSVWTVVTQPFPEAHFAVFPPELIKPCILAGSKENDFVLDPFFGSGTTGFVCEQHNRNWVGIELNSDYCEISNNRLSEIVKEKKDVKIKEKFIREYFV
jgi:DNA modification methylase